MKVTYLDYVRAFHIYSKRYKLSATVRSLMHAIYGEFNVQMWPEELSLSDGEMAELAGVKKRDTIHDAKNLLKELGWIDFKRGKNRVSVIRLLAGNLAGKSAGDLAGDAEAEPEIRMREAKTKEQRQPPGGGAYECREPRYRGDEPWLVGAADSGGTGGV